jgi:hypothetical protein
MVAGRTYKGEFAFAVLVVPLRAALRVLRTSRTRRGETSKAKSAMRWPPRYDRAKLGRVGGRLQVTHTPQASVVEHVPGLAVIEDGKRKPLVMRRRIVG